MSLQSSQNPVTTSYIHIHVTQVPLLLRVTDQTFVSSSRKGRLLSADVNEVVRPKVTSKRSSVTPCLLYVTPMSAFLFYSPNMGDEYKLQNSSKRNFHSYQNKGIIKVHYKFQSPAGAKYLSSNIWVQTGSGAHPASCSMGTGGPFLSGKARPGRDGDHSPHIMPRSWISRSYKSSPPAPT
jgi:hypothetical protein